MQKQSPFHSGEQAFQNALGVREKMEKFGQKVIRPYMPDQHRDFYRQLPFVFVGHSDKEAWPWASILFNKPGFIESETNKSLNIKAKPITGDPLEQSLRTGLPLALLGLEFHSRRRNRATAHVISLSKQGIELNINQSFGNCPKYINSHDMNFDYSQQKAVEIQEIEEFDEKAQLLIAQADTFFVASEVPKKEYAVNEGADISHRGGEKGFVRVDSKKKITIPDYSGNFHFNTLGNFLHNPKAGLLFIDFTTGDVLSLTGTIEIILDSPDIQNFAMAERLWTFEIEKGYWLKNALPILPDIK